MTGINDILNRRIDFVTEDAGAFLKEVPAKWVVYLFADAEDRPVQLLCVKNLRASLKRRLGGEETIGLSKRVNYREVVRRVYWRRVESALEADWVYLEAARRVFPRTYQGMVGFRPAWWVHVNPAAQFPRYTKTIDPTGRTGVSLGPFEDKHAAARMMQIAEDAFDLCRYYNVLIEAPRGKACAYKEMGKCPAPCDGTISMEAYREMVGRSVEAAGAPGEFVAAQTTRMQEEAGALRFEVAGRIKGRIEQVGQLGKGAFRHARRLEEFAFVSLQRGPRAGTAKAFLIVKGEVEEAAGMIAEPADAAELVRYLVMRAEEMRQAELSEQGVERMGVVSHHLFSPKQKQGVFIRLKELHGAALAKAFRELASQKAPEEIEGEGVVKELQAM